jgi:hypothetical protein
MKLEREFFLQSQKESFSDPNHWWNKLASIKETEIDLLPMSFVKKYASYLNTIKRMDIETRFKQNTEYKDYYKKTRDLEDLITTEELEAKLARKEN